MSQSSGTEEPAAKSTPADATKEDAFPSQYAPQSFEDPPLLVALAHDKLGLVPFAAGVAEERELEPGFGTVVLEIARKRLQCHVFPPNLLQWLPALNAFVPYRRLYRLALAVGADHCDLDPTGLAVVTKEHHLAAVRTGNLQRHPAAAAPLPTLLYR